MATLTGSTKRGGTRSRAGGYLFGTMSRDSIFKRLTFSLGITVKSASPPGVVLWGWLCSPVYRYRIYKRLQDIKKGYWG